MSAETPLTLYDFWRSSAAYRVRIALALKNLEWESVPVNLAKGEQRHAAHLDRNPQGLVPALTTHEGSLTQSLAIIEYLDECYPTPALLPPSPIARATVRSLAHQIAMEIHPLNNLRVLNYLVGNMGRSEEEKLSWYRHWIAEGFSALENSLAALHAPDALGKGLYCYGDSVTLADICLVPQVYNARRFECPLAAYPLITGIADHCGSLPAFQAAAPELQADCPRR